MRKEIPTAIILVAITLLILGALHLSMPGLHTAAHNTTANGIEVRAYLIGIITSQDFKANIQPLIAACDNTFGKGNYVINNGTIKNLVPQVQSFIMTNHTSCISDSVVIGPGIYGDKTAIQQAIILIGVNSVK